MSMTGKEPRISVIHYTAPTFAGGVETVIGDFLSLASKLGYKLNLIAGKGNLGNLPGIDIIKIPLLDASSHLIRQANQALKAGENGGGVKNICEEIYQGLSRCINEGDIIHAHNIVTNAFNLPLVIALHRLITTKEDICLLAWCHDTAWGPSVNENYDFSIYPFSLLTTVWPNTHYIALSSKRKKEVQKAMDAPERAISVLSPYLNLQRVLDLSNKITDIIEVNNLLECELCLIYPCRLTRRKNLELAFRIVKQIKDMGKSVRLLVTAPYSPHRPNHSIEYRRELTNLLISLDLTKEVILINSSTGDIDSNTCLDSEDVAGLYRFADLMLFTSNEEGFGLPIVEASLAGIPVMANDRIISEFRHPGTVESFNHEAQPNAVAEKLLSIAKYRMARRRFYLRYCKGKDFWRKLTDISRHVSKQRITRTTTGAR
jgi:glycosyltransferase involved in cell wall biosynthesis